MKSVLKIFPCSTHNVDGVTAWLEDQARHGLFFRKSFGVFAIFRKAPPEEMKYVALRSKIQRNGWSYVGTVSTIHPLYSVSGKGEAQNNQYPKRRWGLLPLCAFLYLFLAFLSTSLYVFLHPSHGNSFRMERLWRWDTVFVLSTLVFFFLFAVHTLPILMQRLQKPRFGVAGRVKNILLVLSLFSCIIFQFVAILAPADDYQEIRPTVRGTSEKGFISKECIPFGSLVSYTEKCDESNSIWISEYRFAAPGIAEWFFDGYYDDFAAILEKLKFENYITLSDAELIEAPPSELLGFDANLQLLTLPDGKLWLVQTGRTVIRFSSILPITEQDILQWLQNETRSG